MKDLSTVAYDTTSEKLVEILCRKTHRDDPLFFRVMVAYYFAKVASMMRVNVVTHDRGDIPVNLYAINLATSGFGKGLSTNIVEDQIINQFRERFIGETFPSLAEKACIKLALKRAALSGDDPDDVIELVKKEFKDLGNLLFSFDGGTPAAVKQMRHKLLMASAGSMNMEIDEIGTNLLGNQDILGVFLELFDVGTVKAKLIKNTQDNVRNEEIIGRTPANMMMFGTPSKLFDGAKVEEALWSFIDTGFGRRCFYGYTKNNSTKSTLTALERYTRSIDTGSEKFITALSDSMGQLADEVNFGKRITMTKDISLLCFEYQIQCEDAAFEMGDHEDMRKAEMTHRYFKAVKLAGVYAFIAGSHEITENHLMAAIKLAEDSGEAFKQLLTRDRTYVKLAKYIAEVGREVTHADLTEDLPFYKGSESAKRDLLSLAIAYGYKNNIIIKRVFDDGIEFLKGESLKLTDESKMVIAYSTDWATDYQPEKVPFNQLHKLTQAPGMHWINHHMVNNHRLESNGIPGFNMVVIDIDKGVSLDTAKMLLKDYTYHMYTTKRHQLTELDDDGSTVIEHGDRFRIVMPMSHTLKMGADEFTEFMRNVFDWLPFDSDEQTSQRSRKWMSCKGEYHDNVGKPLDALNFIPKTAKSEERKKVIDGQQSLSNMERWFTTKTGIGNRSNQLIKYALMLVDSGRDITDVQTAVLELNSKIQDSMKEEEILSTIMKTASKRWASRETGDE